jgi:hypothetical protein
LIIEAHQLVKHFGRPKLSLPEAMPEDTPSERSADVVSRYFEADAQGDTDAMLALFDDDAVVIDERQQWRGNAEIRDWRLGPASKYEYTTTVTAIDRVEDNHYRASGRIDGNFPGATASLKWDFFLADGLISRLEIAP